MQAKVANVSEEFRTSWDELNTANVALMHRKLADGILRRNEGVDIGVGLQEIGWTTGSSAQASSGGVSPDAPKMPRPPRGSSSSSSSSTAVVPMMLAAPAPLRSFAIYTFGADKLAGRFRNSRAASEIRGMVSTKGGPPVPVPDELVCPP